MSQQQMQQRVQLSTASLAIVLCRDEASLSSGAGKFSNPNGYDVFADFKSQNLKSFWNKRLVKAMSEVYFQGWMENFVLLVHGKSNSLEVLRESWMRRALRSPERFIIRAVGDVTAVHMAPISQSQFIPLSEVLCSVISDMNAVHVVVNQEALIEHLMKHHPGMSIPTQDILYSALGSLIKERKIYHTGEGYFIVTPQTYFITNSLMKDNQKWLIQEKDQPSPPSVTYLVSTETCMDTINDFVPSVAHCKSCRCFSQTPAQSAQDLQSISEHNGKGQKCSKDTKPLVQHQSTSTAANYRPCELLTARKDKVCKKFGLNLFRRNISKKEKHKKEYATYSGQFPPEEWPVRDEENLNNLPRDLEHEIIKRINPELTVDNLVRHTIMMKKIEEHRNVISKGTSTEMLATKHRHQSKSIARKVAAKTTKHKKKGHSTKEKQRVKNKLALHRTELGEVIVDGNPENHPDCLHGHLRPKIIEEAELENQICADPNDIERKNLYKKQIDNPFQGRPVRDAGAGKGLKGHKNREMKGSRTERADRSTQRSKSWDSSRTKVVAGNEDIRAVDEGHCKGMKANRLHFDESLDLQPVKECLGDFGSNYPESSTLRIEDKYKLLQNNQPRRNLFGDEPQKDTRYNVVPDGCAAGSLNRRFMARQTEEHRVVEQTVHSLPPQVTYQCDAAGMLPPWPRQTIGQHQPSSLLRQINNKAARNQSGNPDHLTTAYQQLNSKQSGLIIQSAVLQTESSPMGSEVFMDEDQTLYQQAIEDDDACSSLYLNEDSEELESSEDSQSGSVHYQKPYSNSSDWHNTAAQDHSASTCENHPAVFGSCYQQEEARWHDSTNRHLANPQNSTRIENSHRPMSQFIYEHLEEKEREGEEADLVDGSIFDFCQTSEADSDAETLQKSADEGDSKYEHWNLNQQTAENQRKQIEKKLELINNTHSAISGQSSQGVPVSGDYSITGDSGIDSPRTRMSLASSNLVVLEGLKRRSFLQNLENLHSKNNVIRSQNSLLPLTPVINV
ncbi:storkhead-box protein 1-like [Polyodon spathula]|uniref:storkhead-box protein 1-like n=1 Tax=Polyodon spathula TaxID=7913 RepID=UPI001B7F5A27|nr:storkhead-box protein 1-like [Polyodon spathula]